MIDLRRQVVSAQRDLEQELHAGHDQVAVGDAGPLSINCSWKAFTSSAVGGPLSNLLEEEYPAARAIRSKRKLPMPMHHTLFQETKSGSNGYFVQCVPGILVNLRHTLNVYD